VTGQPGTTDLLRDLGPRALGAIVRRYEGLYRRTVGTCDLEDPNRAVLAES